MDFSEFSDYLLTVLKDIIGPLYKVSKTYGIENFNALDDVCYSFWIIGQHMSGSDGIIHIAEATLLSKLTQLIPDQDFKSASTIQRIAANRDAQAWATIEKAARRKPLPLQMMELYDEVHGTNHFDQLRNLYMYFAILMAKADGIAQQEEIEYVDELKIILEKKPKNKPIHKNFEKNEEPSALISSAPRNIDDILKDIDSLIGLSPVKQEIETIINIIKINNMRKSRGLPIISASNHLVFLGNPGTGKTTVARLVAETYKSLGVLRSGHLVETDRSGMVAGYVGQTAIQVKKIVESSLGGVLFIDEAYSLTENGGNDYGKEAINTLLKLMEDYRSDLIVIVAGYPEKMSQFIDSNPGLKSRFNKFLNFPDYTPLEMQKIFEGFVANAALELSPNAAQKSTKIFEFASTRMGPNLGNARFARNLFEHSTARQANRIVTLKNIDSRSLQCIEAEDIDFPAGVL